MHIYYVAKHCQTDAVSHSLEVAQSQYVPQSPNVPQLCTICRCLRITSVENSNVIGLTCILYPASHISYLCMKCRYLGLTCVCCAHVSVRLLVEYAHSMHKLCLNMCAACTYLFKIRVCVCVCV